VRSFRRVKKKTTKRGHIKYGGTVNRQKQGVEKSSGGKTKGGKVKTKHTKKKREPLKLGGGVPAQTRPRDPKLHYAEQPEQMGGVAPQKKVEIVKKQRRGLKTKTLA